MKLFGTITDLTVESCELQRRRYGVIEVIDGKLAGIHFRPWPKIIPMSESVWFGGWQHRPGGRRVKDQCLVYYNQPIVHPSYLSVPFIVSSFGTSFKTVRRSLVVVDEVARIKKSDAIITDVSNLRISDRLMARLGWEPHLPDSHGRHFIRRFYGKFPEKLDRQLESVVGG